MYIYRHPQASCRSARTLSRLLGFRLLTQGRLRPRRSNRGTYIVNYGVCDMPVWGREYRWINNPSHVRVAAKKDQCFQRLTAHDVPTVEWTTITGEAISWLNNNHTVFSRVLLNSHSGRGILLANTVNELQPAPLYTRNYPKTHEYRVFVCNNEVIDIAQKRVRNGVNENRSIRTHNNGWVYTHENIYCPGNINDIALWATEALQLDFAAVDILSIRSRRTGEFLDNSVVCEVNTAPGLHNTVTKTNLSSNILSIVNG